MDSVPPDVTKLILNDLSIPDLVNFLKTNKSIKHTYLNDFADKIEQATPKTGKFKNSEVSLKFKLYPILEYHEITFDEEVERIDETMVYGQMSDIHPSMPQYREILVANVPFVIRAFNGTGFHYSDFEYQIYAHKTLLYSEAMENVKYRFGTYTKYENSYLFEGANVDLYLFNQTRETNVIDRCEIAFGVK